MEQVAQLLQAFDLGAALVRLWVMAGDAQQLVKWEHQYYASNETARNAKVNAFQKQISTTSNLPLWEMNENAIALIRAIDALLASNHHRSRLLRPYSVNEKNYWLILQLVDWRAHTATKGQSNSLLTWFSHHTIIPAETPEKIQIKLYQSEGETSEFMLQLLAKPGAGIKIWIGHFADGADVQWDQPRPIEKSCRTTEVSCSQTRATSLLAQLERAKNAGANFIVFPEFALDIAQRKMTAQWLKSNECPQLLYTVPGSFHELEAGNTGTTQPEYFNTAPLFDAAGNVIFTHQKLQLFGKDGLAENISIGNTLHVLATPVGCLTVLICKDFMDKNARVANLLQHVLVDWVLVPSFGDETTIKGHKAKARELAKIISGTNSAVANAQNTAMNENAKFLPGFAHRSQEDKPKNVSETGEMIEFFLPNRPPNSDKSQNISNH